MKDTATAFRTSASPRRRPSSTARRTRLVSARSPASAAAAPIRSGSVSAAAVQPPVRTTWETVINVAGTEANPSLHLMVSAMTLTLSQPEVEFPMHTVLTVLAIVGFLAILAFTSWMRSKNGPLKKYRRDYRNEHENDRA